MAYQIDFNPEPAAGSDPLASVTQGLGLGLGLANQYQSFQKAQQDQEIKLKQQEMEKRKAGIDEMSKAFEIYKKSPSRVRPFIAESLVAPAIKSVFPDSDLSPEILKGFDDDVLEEAGQVTKNLSEGLINFDQFQAQMAHLRTKADEETSNRIGQIASGVRPTGMSDYQEAMLALRRDMMNEKSAEKTGQKESAMARVSGNLKTMASLYNDLSNKGGIVDISKTGVENIPRRISSSAVGQNVGRAFGTEEQSIRNRINQIRPLLMNDIRKATEMGARGLDSEKELEFYLQAATNPELDIQSNLAALDVLDKAYGLGLGVSASAGAGPGWSDEKERRYQELLKKRGVK